MDSTSIGALLQQAGWTMAPLYVCSVLAGLVAARKALDLRAAKLRDESWVQPTLNALAEGAAMRAADVARQAAAHGAESQVTLWVSPGSEQIQQTIGRDGQLQELDREEKILKRMSFIESNF